MIKKLYIAKKSYLAIFTFYTKSKQQRVFSQG